MSGDSGSAIKMEPAAIGLRIQTSIYGNCVPVVFGKTRVSGNLMWVGDFAGVKVANGVSGGKGGGGGTPKTWNYRASFMLALSEGPITAVAKAGWADKSVVPNMTGDTTETKTVIKTVTFIPSSAGRTIQVCAPSDFISSDIVMVPSHDFWLTEGTDYTVSPTGLYTFSSSRDGLSLSITFKQTTLITNVGLLTPFLGGYSQMAWSHMTANHPTEAIAYRGIAYAAANSFDLGGSPDLPNLTFEVTGWNPFQAGVIDDADPKAVITTILSDPHIGVGFPSAKLGSMAQFSNFCVANSLFISPAYNQQAPAATVIEDLLKLTNTSAFFSEDKLKFVPRSDSPATGNGVTYTPSAPVLYDLDDNDFLDADAPVRVTRSSNTDAFNQLQVEYYNRDTAYNQAVQEAKDQAGIDTFGLRPADSVTAHQIVSSEVARFVAQLLLQRAMYVRNTYEFRLGLQYCLLEPEDVVTLTDQRLGLDRTPVRIVSIEEDEDNAFRVEAEDFPAGVSSAALYATPDPAGYAADLNADPGDITAPVFFEAPIFWTKTGLAVCAAVSGDSASWGGAHVYVSYDASTYKYAGEIQGGSRYGITTGAITSAANQVLPVKLSGKQNQLYSGTSQEAANMATAILVGGEFIGYTTATLTGVGTYNLTSAVRGGYGSVAASHVSGERFVRLDDGIMVGEDLELSMVGKTIYFKFCSFNLYGGAERNLADVQAFPYTITGAQAKRLPPDVAGFTIFQTLTGWQAYWTKPSFEGYDRTELRIGTVANSWETATPIVSVSGSRADVAIDSALASNIVWAKHFDIRGNASAVAAVYGLTIPLGLWRLGAKGASDLSGPFASALYSARTMAVQYNPSVAAQLHMVRISRTTGQILGSQYYAMYYGAPNSITQMIADLNALPNSQIVIIFTAGQWDVQPMLNTAGFDAAMQRCGASAAILRSASFKQAAAYALIGIPGIGTGNGYEAYQGAVNNDTVAFCDVSFQITHLGQLVVSGAENKLLSVGTTLIDPNAATDIVSVNIAGPITPTYDGPTHPPPTTVATVTYTPPVSCELLLTVTGVITGQVPSKQIFFGFSNLADGATEPTWGEWPNHWPAGANAGDISELPFTLSKRISGASAGVAQTWKLKAIAGSSVGNVPTFRVIEMRIEAIKR